jgi:uncharacterized damage-inducible protein DinB
MRSLRIVFSFAASALLTQALFAQSQMAKMFDGQLKMLESEVVTLAEAMPADKYDFAPTQGEFKGVRTFGQQVTHIAETNYEVASAILGAPAPDVPNAKNLKSKDEIVAYLKASLAYSHKAVATITDANAFEPVKSPFGSGKTTRMYLGTVFAWHSFDHYGQMVVYARMNGVIPPASKN